MFCWKVVVWHTQLEKISRPQSLMGCSVGAWQSIEKNTDNGGLACQVSQRSRFYRGCSCDSFWSAGAEKSAAINTRSASLRSLLGNISPDNLCRQAALGKATSPAGS